MADVWFYHMTETPLERTLPRLLIGLKDRGGRVFVKGTEQRRIQWLDRMLWEIESDPFLPHGQAGGEFDADQPILLAAGEAPLPGGIDYLLTLDGAGLGADDIAQVKRTYVLFDGNDGPMLDVARAQWKQVVALGVPAKYWAETGGKWEVKAQSPAEATT